MTEIEIARAEIARLSTAGLPWNIKLDVRDASSGDLPAQGPWRAWEIVLRWSPVDVDTGRPTTITFHLDVRPNEPILDAARRAIRAVVLHEIDEQLTVDGVRRWEPHLLCDDGTRRPILRRVDEGQD